MLTTEISKYLVGNRMTSCIRSLFLFLVPFSYYLVVGTTFPEHEYRFLQQLYESTNGDSWFNNRNWNFENISLYNPCTTQWYGLLFPSCTGSTPGITIISLYRNNLVGIFPPIISNFTNLRVIDVSYNHLYGKLPSFFNLPQLYLNINFASNLFDGNLTQPIFDFESSQNVYELVLSENSFTGSLPTWIYSLSKLWLLDLSDNFFDGEIQEVLTGWQRLEMLYLSNNHFVGPVFHSLMYLSTLHSIYVALNYFSEELPSNVSSSTFSFLDLHSNTFYGTIPTWICQQSSLLILYLDENYFDGTFPICFSNVTGENGLIEFSISKNSLTGRLDQLFAEPSNFPDLQALDFSFNQFTGPFPIQIFNFPSILLIAGSVNCFDRRLEDTFCNYPLASELTLINLNGLHSGESCQTSIEILPSYFGSEMKGTIPSCFWSIGKLASLELAGNAFHGSLPSNITVPPFLKYLSLSHNLLTGSIPAEIQRHSFRTLDLSYNKLSGDVRFVDNISLATIDGSWNISNNRISGHLPDIFHKARNIQVLFGNVFECSNDLPENDPNYSNYFCGSSELDYATYGFAVVIGSVLVVCLYLYWVGKGVIRKMILVMSTREVELVNGVSGGEVVCKEDKQNIQQFLATLTHLIEFGGYCFLYVLLVLLPLILLLNTTNTHYRKYEYEYNWISTASNLRGIVPSVCLLIIWFAAFLVFLTFISFKSLPDCVTEFNKFSESAPSERSWSCFKKRDNLSTNVELRYPLVTDYDRSNIQQEQQITVQYYAFVCFMILLLNITISITINIFYLISLGKASRLNGEIAIQMLMAVFKLIWNFMIVNNMMNQLQQSFTKHKKESFQLRIFLLVFNNILVPCIASIVYDGSCFHDFFFGTQFLTEQEEYVVDSSDGTSAYSYTGSGFQLPFMYYYSCGSQILRSYIPIFLYTYTLLPIKNIAEYVLLSRVQISSWMPQSVYSLIPGIFRPGDYERFPILFRGDSKMALLVLHLSVLFTFGLTTPILAMLVILVIVLDCVEWKYLILRFINYGRFKDGPAASPLQSTEREGVYELSSLLEVDDQSSENLEGQLTQRVKLVNDSLQGCSLFVFHARWRIFYCSMLFIGLLLFDFVGDEQGALVTLWVPSVVLCLTFLIRFYLVILLRYSCQINQKAQSDSTNMSSSSSDDDHESKSVVVEKE